MSWASIAIVTGLLFLAATPSEAFYRDDCYNSTRGEERELCLRRSLLRRQAVAAPSSSCPKGCTVHGVCHEDIGRCDCPRHFTGPACSTVVPSISKLCAKYSIKLRDFGKDSPCFNNCNQRGRCIAGICHCQPGYWGIDCAISWGPNGKMQLLDGNYVERKTGVKVYIYELPSNMTSWYPFMRMDRPVHLMFWQRLMSSGMRTLDGNKADYFYIPINTRTGSLAREELEWTLPYIKKTYPWWSKDNGNRHLIIHTGDMGINDFPLATRRELNESLSNITWLTHWGLHEYHPIAKWYPAHRPGKDIVIPVMIMTQGFHLSPMNPRMEAEIKAQGAPRLRNGTLFFAGRICGDRDLPDPKTGKCGPGHEDYSFGVRQAVYLQHRNVKGFRIVAWTSTYLEDISSHKFCLAPVGGGHGKRNILVAFMGCLPVLIGDHVLQPFEPEIDWSRFSISVPEADIPDLPRILANVPASEVASKQKRLRCAAQHMFYSSTLGAILGEDGRYDAFETLMEILRVRKEHPDVPPEKYQKVDQRFRKFINCDLDDEVNPVPLCTQGKEMQLVDRKSCKDCRRKDGTSNSFFNSAGGMLCCEDHDMTKCPRGWK
ncbi:acetylglucosaminyltransferase [Volvox carteri f. nagariensis]|uniref:Acetylglucosaminyltransferase n=1 Tax=Volvox carteri f. nagariensis TaxID=3068 RepID=D8U627_VOLCA|nr:acetylglucosaminyltransferase [Volvox carteri f. nagariensis]EFJ44782.1 acetylglucosaminyltransferase [Volvox carteri f. nagariensis]|eukprot:XP_002954065.1 acetylglucosaminyltransferase [Volvox carteri f. nagariensis]